MLDISRSQSLGPQKTPYIGVAVLIYIYCPCAVLISGSPKTGWRRRRTLWLPARCPGWQGQLQRFVGAQEADAVGGLDEVRVEPPCSGFRGSFDRQRLVPLRPNQTGLGRLPCVGSGSTDFLSLCETPRLARSRT